MKQFLTLLFAFLLIGCGSPLNKSSDAPLSGPPGPPASSTAVYEVTISSTEGGMVTPWIGTKTCQDQVLSVQAYAFPGYVFSHWTGKVANEFSSATIVLVNENVDIVAHFVKIYNG